MNRSAVTLESEMAQPMRPAHGAAARVFMMDLLSIVPYYTSELSAALLRSRAVELELGAITYYLDRECHQRNGLTFTPGLVDLVSRIPGLPRVIRRSAKTLEYLANLGSLSIRFRSSRPDLVHVQFLPLVLFGSKLELHFLRSLRRQGVKIVYTVHNVLPHDAAAKLRSYYAEIYGLADQLICHDAAARRKLIEEFAQSPSRISVIAHGPLLPPGQATSSDSARQRLGLLSQECLILWQGILRPYKGVGFLLDVWKQVRSENGRARLIIAGGGDEAIEREIREKVAALNVSHSVRLDLRFVSVAELQDYHSAADVLVYPYSEVTTSGALMTGIGYGKAILASRLPAFEQILRHDQNALLASYGDTVEWALELERLIANPDLRTRLGKTSSSPADWDQIAAQTVACYESVLQRGSGAR
jgi:glycosyltransferase involved in cell wall biosynthesis